MEGNKIDLKQSRQTTSKVIRRTNPKPYLSRVNFLVKVDFLPSLPVWFNLKR
jgi:hypothetical protein